MNNEIPLEIKLAFEKSLQHSFSTRPTEIFDGEFPVTQNSLITDEFISTDEWQGHGSRTTTGNDIVTVRGITYSRVYAGGTINHDKIILLGINESKIMEFLTSIVQTYADRIRLDEDFAIVNGDWQYHYECTSSNPKIPIWLGEEVIYYQNQLVFQHNFMICPVEA